VARILIVDDSASIRETLDVVLRDAGHETLFAADGAEALATYRREKPALAIVDIFMPKLDGVETITALRREIPPPKIIAISAGGSLGRLEVPHGRPYDALVDARLAGVDLALSKPFDAALIREAVQEVLARPPDDD
jgi:CheY-like chemotaxis protein